MKYPNIKKGVRWCCIVGGVVGSLWFGLTCWLSTIPPASDVSLSLALRPWWKWSNWSLALFFALITGLPVGILAAFRPDIRDTKQKEKHNTEPGAAPNGGPATQPGNSGVTEGPPSVS